VSPRSAACAAGPLPQARLPSTGHSFGSIGVVAGNPVFPAAMPHGYRGKPPGSSGVQPSSD
jgi:hypothetical protein